MTQPRRFLPLLGALMGVFCGWVQAQSVDVVRTADLRFGSMVVVSHGTQAINPQTGLTSGTAHVLRPSSLANSVGAAEFVVTCTSSSYPVVYTLAITSPSTNTLIGPDDLTAFTVFSSLHGNPALSVERTVNNCTGYSETVKVGATLALTSATAGTYTLVSSVTLQATTPSNN